MNTARDEFKFGVNFIAVLKCAQKIAAAARNFKNDARNFGGARWARPSFLSRFFAP